MKSLRKPSRRRLWKRAAAALLLSGLLSGALIGGLRWWTHAAYANRIYDNAATVPAEAAPRVAVVFGAGVWPGGEPSPILYDRIATAAELYKQGRVRTLLLTGDNRFKNYNEPETMRQTALALGVPEAALVLDFAGRRTFDSCYRAREIFGVRRAILITQGFHLDRALYLCDSLGIDSIGLRADRRAYPADAHLRWSLREIPATLAAWSDLNLLRPAPVLGEKLPMVETTNAVR